MRVEKFTISLRYLVSFAARSFINISLFVARGSGSIISKTHQNALYNSFLLRLLIFIKYFRPEASGCKDFLHPSDEKFSKFYKRILNRIWYNPFSRYLIQWQYLDYKSNVIRFGIAYPEQLSKYWCDCNPWRYSLFPFQLLNPFKQFFIVVILSYLFSWLLLDFWFKLINYFLLLLHGFYQRHHKLRIA